MDNMLTHNDIDGDERDCDCDEDDQAKISIDLSDHDFTEEELRILEDK